MSWCPSSLSRRDVAHKRRRSGPGRSSGPPDRPPVDPAAADRGRGLYGVECITCHGPSARGTDTRQASSGRITVLNDRYGSLLGPFFKKGHPMQSGKPSTALTDAQVVDLMHFLRQRINDTLRGSDVFDVKDILTGDPKAGEAYFTGDGKCTAAIRRPATWRVLRRGSLPRSTSSSACCFRRRGGRGAAATARPGARPSPSRSRRHPARPVRRARGGR